MMTDRPGSGVHFYNSLLVVLSTSTFRVLGTMTDRPVVRTSTTPFCWSFFLLYFPCVGHDDQPSWEWHALL